MSQYYRNKLFGKVLMFAFVVFSLLGHHAQATQDVALGGESPTQLLQRYANVIEQLKTFRAKATVVHVFGEKRNEIWYHQACAVDVQQKKFSLIRGDNPDFEYERATRYEESIVDTTSRLVVALGERSNDLVVNFRDDLTPLQWDVAFSETPFGSPLHFYELQGVSKPVHAFMSSLPLRAGWQESEGSRYAVLSAESRKCRFEMWLDPQSDFALKKFLFHSEANNELALGVKSYTYEVHEFGSEVEFYFPRKITTELSSYEMEGTVEIPGQESRIVKIPGRTTKQEISFYDVEVNPKFTESTFRLKKMPPNYYQVAAINKMQLRHIWHDGKVIPLTDELALARARGHGFIPGVREPRFWLLALGIGLILIALGRIAYRHFNR